MELEPERPLSDPEPEAIKPKALKPIAVKKIIPLRRFDDLQSLETALAEGQIGSDHHALEKDRLLGLERATQELRERERQEKLAATQAEVLKHTEVIQADKKDETEVPQITEHLAPPEDLEKEELKPEVVEEVIVAEVVTEEIEEEEDTNEIPVQSSHLVEVLMTNRGQFADVQIGRTAENKLVGIKKFHEPEDLRFDREVAAYERLKTIPAVPKLLETGEDEDGKLYFVFEVDEGQRVLTDEVLTSLPLKTRLKLTEQLIIVACVMNDLGVRHGDWANTNTAISGEDLKTFDFDFSVISSDPRFSTEDMSRQGIDQSLADDESGGASHRRFETHAQHKGEKLDDLRDRVQAAYLASFFLSLQTPSIEGWGFLKEETRERLKTEIGKDPDKDELLGRYDRLVQAIILMAGDREHRPLYTASIMKILDTPEAVAQLSPQEQEALAVIPPLATVEQTTSWQMAVNFFRRLIGREEEPPALPLPLGFVASDDQINRLRRLRLDEQYRRCVQTLVKRGIIPSDVHATIKDIEGQQSVMPSFLEIWQSLNLERLLTLEKYFSDPVLLVVPFGIPWEKLYRCAASPYSTFYASNSGLMSDKSQVLQADRSGLDAERAQFLYYPHREDGGSTKAGQLADSTIPGKRGWRAIIADAAKSHPNRGESYSVASRRLETEHLQPLTVEDWLVMLLVSEEQGTDLDHIRHSRSGTTGTVCGLGTAIKKDDQIFPLTACIAPFEGLNIRASQSDSTYDHRITRQAMELI